MNLNQFLYLNSHKLSNFKYNFLQNFRVPDEFWTPVDINLNPYKEGIY